MEYKADNFFWLGTFPQNDVVSYLFRNMSHLCFNSGQLSRTCYLEMKIYYVILYVFFLFKTLYSISYFLFLVR